MFSAYTLRFVCVIVRTEIEGVMSIKGYLSVQQSWTCSLVVGASVVAPVSPLPMLSLHPNAFSYPFICPKNAAHFAGLFGKCPPQSSKAAITILPIQAQLDSSYEIKTCIDWWPNGTAKSSQLARKPFNCLTTTAQSPNNITKRLGNSWHELAEVTKRWKLGGSGWPKI